MDVYIQMEIKARELEGRSLLALAAAERGHHVLLGDVERYLDAGVLPPGLFHDKDLTPTAKKVRRLSAYRAEGHRITSQDEEHWLALPTFDVARADLEGALDRLRGQWPTLLAERFVSGVELTCGVLEGEDGAEAMPCVEIAPRGDRFFDYETKYDPGLVDEIVPARIPPAAELALRRLAVAAHHALGCRGVSRTDAIFGADGQLVLLETNTLPGLTPASLLPKAAAAAGLDYPTLLERILARAMA